MVCTDFIAIDKKFVIKRMSEVGVLEKQLRSALRLRGKALLDAVRAVVVSHSSGVDVAPLFPLMLQVKHHPFLSC